MSKIKTLFDKKYRSRTLSYLLVIAVYMIVELLIHTGNMKTMYKNLLVPISCFVVATISLNLVVGFSGELSLGHAGFMSLGAFTGVIVSGYLAGSITNTALRLAIAIIAGAIVAGLFGLLISIPVLKLEGDYLAIVTLAFCQIIKSVINNVYLGFDDNGFQFSFINNELDIAKGGKVLINGPIGATGTQRISTFTAGIVLILLTLTIVYHLIYSKHGRAIMAGRDNRIAAQSVGINVTQSKTLAFVIASALAGAAGALYALNNTTFSSAKFDYNQSILILVYVVLGGLGKINGSMISATVLMLLPEMLRFLSNYRMLIYAIVLILMMLVTNNEQLKSIFHTRFKKGKKKEEA